MKRIRLPWDFLFYFRPVDLPEF